MRKAIIVLITSLVCLCLCTGCSRKTTEAYAMKKRTELRTSVTIDSTYLKQLFADFRNTQTHRIDSIVVKDSVIIREKADGSTDTYRERTTEKVGNYVQIEQMNQYIEELKEQINREKDTIFIETKDTTYIYKVQSISRIQEVVNYFGIFGTIFVLFTIFAVASWYIRKK